MSPRKKKDPTETADETPDLMDLPEPTDESDSDGSVEATEAAIAHAVEVVAAKPEPDPIVVKVMTSPRAEGIMNDTLPCALESAVVGAKCVVSRTDAGKAVRLLDPSGATTLDPSDLFYILPAGAKVRKVSETQYDAFTLGQSDQPRFSAASAREAVTRYLTLQ